MGLKTWLGGQNIYLGTMARSKYSTYSEGITSQVSIQVSLRFAFHLVRISSLHMSGRNRNRIRTPYCFISIRYISAATKRVAWQVG